MNTTIFKERHMLFYIIFFCILPYIGSSQILSSNTTFIVDGYIHGNGSKKIYLIYTTGIIPHVIKDTSQISHNGYFKFTGNVTEPTMAFLLGKMKSNSVEDPNFNSFFLEAGHTKIEGKINEFKNMKINGSLTQNIYEELKKMKENVSKKMKSDSANLHQYIDDYHAAIQNNSDSAKLNILKSKILFTRSLLHRHSFEYNAEDIQFIKAHPSSYISGYLLDNDMLSRSLDTLMEMYEILSDKIKMSRYGKDIYLHIQKIRKGLPGNDIKYFLATGLNDYHLKASVFGKKYILLDFWDSWCVPCRRETPLLLKLYDKYHHKGLEIIGIAGYEPDSAAWRKAIVEDKTQRWYQILDKQDTVSNDIAGVISNRFGIYVIPSQILINPNGIIIGRYGGNTKYTLKNLQRKLNQIFENE